MGNLSFMCIITTHLKIYEKYYYEQHYWDLWNAFLLCNIKENHLWDLFAETPKWNTCLVPLREKLSHKYKKAITSIIKNLLSRGIFFFFSMIMMNHANYVTNGNLIILPFFGKIPWCALTLKPLVNHLWIPSTNVT